MPRLLGYGPSTIPPRIRATLAYARYCAFSTRPASGSTQPRSLTRLESATQSAALTLLRDYFTGDIDFESPTTPPARPDDPSLSPKLDAGS